MRMKYVLTIHILITVIGIALLLSGCAMTEAQREAGDLYFSQHSRFPIATSSGETLRRPISRLKCRHRVALVARGMIRRGDTFDIVGGSCPRRGHHVWIVQYHEGKELIIEPTLMDGQVAYFKHDQIRLRYLPGNPDPKVIDIVNRWLREIGAKEV